MSQQACEKPFRQCQNLLCNTHGLGPLSTKRYVGLRQPGESDADVQRRLYLEAMRAKTAA